MRPSEGGGGGLGGTVAGDICRALADGVGVGTGDM